LRSGETPRKNRLQRLLSPGGTLSQRVVRGGFWVFALRIVDRLFKLVRTIVLARLLAPKDFGLFGIALLAMSALETFSQTGFQQALIQTKRDIRPYLDTTWTVQAIRGAALALILFGIGPYVAAFFGEPAAATLLRVLGLSMLFQGFANIGVVYFQKELEFHKQFVYQLSGTLVDLVVAITAALLLRSAWALIFGLLAANFVRMVVSYLIHPYRPRLRLEGAKAKELYGFGRWVLGSSMLVFLLTQGDDALVGKLLGATALAFYQMAYRISNMPATEYSHLIATVTFPAYSKLQDNLLKSKEAYLKALQLTAFLSIPIAGMIFVLAPEFTKIFLGEKWLPMVPAMQVLALYGGLRAIGATTGVVFMALGKPDIMTKIQIGQLVLLAILIYPLTMRWGILGASIAVTAYALIFNLVAVYKVLNIVKSDYEKPTKLLMLPSIGTLVMVSAIYVSKTYVFGNVGLAYFVLFIIVGIFAYLSIVYLFDRFLSYGSRLLLQEQLTALSRYEEDE